VGILHAYLKRGANPNQQIQAEGSRGNTPLHNAVLLEKSDHVEVLLDAGADPDILNQYGLTPLEMLPSQALPSTKTYYKRLFEVDKLTYHYIISHYCYVIVVGCSKKSSK
jgi:ankyrin repeat protein